MPLVESNYEVAWSLMLNRYNNPRLLFMHHMHTLFSLPTLTKEKSDDIKTLLNVANLCVNEFKRLKLPITSCDHWVAYFLASKLPKDTHQAWEHHLGCEVDIPTFSKLESFLNNRLITIDVLENRNCVADTLSKVHKTNHHEQRSGNLKKSFITTSDTKIGKCYLCKGDHILRRCPQFLTKNCFERKSIVDKANLCLNCLSKTHTVSRCPSVRNCRTCEQRHHTTLHFPTQTPTILSSPAQTNNSGAGSALNITATTFSPSHQGESTQSASSPLQLLSNTLTDRRSCKVLLATAVVTLLNNSTGESAKVRALIDQGSECTIISEHAAQTLRLNRTSANTEISGVGQGFINLAQCSVSFGIRSRIYPNIIFNVDQAFVLKSVTSNLPSHSFDPPSWFHIEGLTLADPLYYQSSRIDLLLGADMVTQILLPEIRLGNRDTPLAQNTHFGWVLMGKVATLLPNSPTATVRCHHSTFDLESMVKQLYEDDHVPQETKLTAEEDWCERFFKETYRRQLNGKYMVRLPLKSRFSPHFSLGKSKQIALTRFYSLERKLNHNLELRKRYSDGIAEYFELSQIKPASTSEEEHTTLTATGIPTVTSCILPHHAVLKEDNLSTKLRIVFDASCKTSNGSSLNDLLCIGAPLQNNLAAVLLNWRKHKFVFTAEIQRMYRCIDMNPEDAQYQRILWRDCNQTIKEYCLTTVTFGTASAPYTAIRVLHQIADDEKPNFPLAEPVLKQETYVDDILSGSHSIHTTVEIRDQVLAALKSAGMELRKWSSNSTSVLENIASEHTSTSKLRHIPEKPTLKTLGIYWQPDTDIFKYKMSFDPKQPTTKRNILLLTARFFDPLGMISPVIITAKILFKEACALRVQDFANVCKPYDWDVDLPAAVNKKWESYLETLKCINMIEIPRWVKYNPTNIKSAQIHTICDGSAVAYAACVYLRLTFINEEVHTTLIYSKARVTPAQKLTIPRIELQGAVLATQIAEWVSQSLQLPTISICSYFWTDATIVLYWLRGEHGRLQIWVSNRVNKILRSSTPHQWNHIETALNPADCATRGRNPRSLSKFKLWGRGPEWLKLQESEWPKFDTKGVVIDPNISEEKPDKVVMHFTISNDSLLYKYSSFDKLIRMCAYIYRFVFNSHAAHKQCRRWGPLSTEEYQFGLNKIVALVQREAFCQKIYCLQAHRPIPSKSRLRNLSPYLDEHNVLRVRGRMANSGLSFSRKHPIILPSKHPFTRMAIDHAHYAPLHGGAQLTLSYLRHRFWILNGRRVVQLHLRKCLTCFRQNPTPTTQLMGDLPLHRVTPPQRAFLATGIDYTGAIELKASRYRGTTTYKGYIALFICLATKAIHLEAVTGLSTDHFLMALRRFVGRRGICKDIYSDCGTNFLGAERVLLSSKSTFADSIRTITPELTKSNIKWHFNPPYSPNFGGLWESNIKSVKYHLKRVIGGTKLTYEELTTVLVGIEACLNSRPLCPLTTDPEDLFVLTPGDFLIRDALLAPPETTADSSSLIDMFLQTQRMVKHFWTRWSIDWLSHLQTRPKWFKEADNIQTHDLVIVKEDRAPPHEWVMGRVIETHPGRDTLIRVVTVRTPKGIYKRSISKICPLPLSR